MRGKGPAGQILVVSVGITPACAGKSRSQPRLPCTGRDHPRACGEKRFASASLDAYWGSPPHVRGKEPSFSYPEQPDGITPAYAGKSPPESDFAGHRWDHPRVCGEKLTVWVARPPKRGSPPRVRGKASTNGLHPTFARITPAYAGKSQKSSSSKNSERDCPRVCGEKARLGRFWLSAWGSPLRVRGKASKNG